MVQEVFIIYKATIIIIYKPIPSRDRGWLVIWGIRFLWSCLCIMCCLWWYMYIWDFIFHSNSWLPCLKILGLLCTIASGLSISIFQLCRLSMDILWHRISRLSRMTRRFWLVGLGGFIRLYLLFGKWKLLLIGLLLVLVWIYFNGLSLMMFTIPFTKTKYKQIKEKKNLNSNSAFYGKK